MKIAIIGAGIAGLSSAWFLKEHVESMDVFESSHRHGGLAQSFEWNGFTCDIAPHRLYPDSVETRDKMLSLCPMNEIRRESQIFIGGKWIADPVNAAEIMIKFFPRSLGIGWDYVTAKFKPSLPDDNFEALVLNQFGHGLNNFFFKPYSEKLFGIDADQISAEWGRRKIRVGGLKDMIRRKSKLYFKTFYYPKSGGYGAITDAMLEPIRDRVHFNTKVLAIDPLDDGSGYRVAVEGADGLRRESTYDYIISSLPISVMAKMLGHDLGLTFRPATLLYLLIDKPQVTSNHWFYFADACHIINRVAEFKNFQGGEYPEGKTVICCEITRREQYSPERVVQDLEKLGIFRASDVLDQMELPVSCAYPIYDLDYTRRVAEASAIFAKHPRIMNIGRHAEFAHRDVDEIFESAEEICQELLARTNGAPAQPATAATADAVSA